MAHLLKALFAGLLIALLFAGTAYADDRDRANELMKLANVLRDDANALGAQTVELLNKVMEIDPTGKDGADALPILAEAKPLFAEMKKDEESVRRCSIRWPPWM